MSANGFRFVDYLMTNLNLLQFRIRDTQLGVDIYTNAAGITERRYSARMAVAVWLVT